MMEKPIVRPVVWTFVPNALPHPLQNLTVKLVTAGLTGGYELLVKSSLGVEKNNQHVLDIAANLTCFFLATVNLATSTAMIAA
jgi:hypothetical protein